MSYYGCPPYVPVAQRRAQAACEIEKLRKKGRTIAPVVIEGRTIARNFWGKAWCENLERYSDFANRLPRGKTYLLNGSVVDLQVEKGQIRALVMGSSLYNVKSESALFLPHIGGRSARTPLARSRRWWSCCPANCRRTSWSASAAKATVCFRRRMRSNCPAPALMGRACANMWPQHFMARARGWIRRRTCSSPCAASTVPN